MILTKVAEKYDETNDKLEAFLKKFDILSLPPCKPIDATGEHYVPENNEPQQ